MSPVVDGEPECFAVRRGEFEKRIDCHYYKPIYFSLVKKLSRLGAVRLDTFGDVICGPFGSAIKSEEYKPWGIPLIRITNITEAGDINLEGMIFISEEKASSLSSTQVNPGDIVISQRGTLGNSAIVPHDYPVWNISANLLAIRQPKNINPEFVQLYLGSSIGRRLIERFTSGQVQGKITTQDIASLPILKRSNEAILVNDMAKARQNWQNKLAKAEALLAGLDEFVRRALNIPGSNNIDRQTFAVLLINLKESHHIDQRQLLFLFSDN